MEYYSIIAQVPITGNEEFFANPDHQKIKTKNRCATLEIARIYPAGRAGYFIPHAMIRCADNSGWDIQPLDKFGDNTSLIKAFDHGDLSALDLTPLELKSFFAPQGFKLEYRKAITDDTKVNQDLIDKTAILSRRKAVFSTSSDRKVKGARPTKMFTALIPVIFSPQTA